MPAKLGHTWLTTRVHSADESGAGIGTVTSVTEGFALGYIRCKSRGQQVALEGKQVSLLVYCNAAMAV